MENGSICQAMTSRHYNLIKIIGCNFNQGLRSVKSPFDLSLATAPHRRATAQLKGKRKGQHSIRINDQWRICFVWKEESAIEVEIVDYHKG